MSLQEVFDKICTAVIAQGKRSINSSTGLCLYRGPDNTKCAVGHLLTDEQIEKYHIKDEYSVNNFSIKLINELVPNVNANIAYKFLLQMQHAHDDSRYADHFIYDFKYNANITAKLFNLKELE